MNFLFGHYAGSRNATTKAIATLQEIEAMFRTHTPRSVIGPQNLANLVRWRQKLDRGEVCVDILTPRPIDFFSKPPF